MTTESRRLYVNGQPGATTTTRLVRRGMLSVKRRSHVLRHVMTLR